MMLITDRRTTKTSKSTVSIGDYWELTESDLKIAQALQLFGWLPTHYLFPFSERESYQMFQKRLTRLVHEPPHFLKTVGPKGFFANCYDITGYAEEMLYEHGMLLPHVPARFDHPNHRMYNACVGASFQLGARRKGLTYVSVSQAIAYEKCPQTTQAMGNPLQIPLIGMNQKYLIPDGLFALRYGSLARIFFVETDRGTTPLRRSSNKKKALSFHDKLEGYLNIIENNTAKNHLGFPKFTVLTLTSSKLRMENILSMLKEATKHKPSLAEHFAFQVNTDLAHIWKVPKQIMWGQIDEPWYTTTAPFDISKP